MKRNRFSRALSITFVQVLALIAILLVGLALFVMFSPAYAFPKEMVALADSALQNQEQVEKAIQAEYQAGKYSLAEPLVIQNPYGTAPLTALLVFDTPEMAQISVHVPGKTPEAAVDFPFPGLRTHHEIPIYGLYAGTNNAVTIQATNQAGESQQSKVMLQTEPLPVYLEPMIILQSDRSQYSPGFNFTFFAKKPIYDIDAAVRWYSTESSFNKILTPLKNGRFLYDYDNPVNDHPILMEKDLLGKIYAVYPIPYSVHHDVIELPNGNLLMTIEETQSSTKMDILLEMDRSNGHIVRTIDLKNYLDPQRAREINRPPYDWLHLNSIYYDDTDQSIVISGRSQSAVVKFSYPQMKIQWILGPHENWSSAFQPYLFTPVGDNFEWQWSQHHATVYHNSGPGDHSLDVLLFDNALYGSFQQETAHSPRESYSRIVLYQIAERTKTVKQAWEYGKERGTELFSISQGSVYPLRNGNLLGTWSNISKDVEKIGLAEALKERNGGQTETRMIEVNPESGGVVYEVGFLNVSSYRIIRAGLYDRYSEKNLMKTPVNNTISSDFMDRLHLFWKDFERWVALQLVYIKRFGRWVLRALGLRSS